MYTMPNMYFLGTLPSRSNLSSVSLSPKVFLGGVPWDISEPALANCFKQFGPIRVEWPGREAAFAPSGSIQMPRGYLYVIFESDKQVGLSGNGF